MRTAARIARAERALGLAGPCARCGGWGWGASIIEHEGGPTDGQRTECGGCPDCGRRSHARRIVLELGPRDRAPPAFVP